MSHKLLPIVILISRVHAIIIFKMREGECNSSIPCLITSLLFKVIKTMPGVPPKIECLGPMRRKELNVTGTPY